jgi:DnaK suppressor protein
MSVKDAAAKGVSVKDAAAKDTAVKDVPEKAVPAKAAKVAKEAPAPKPVKVPAPRKPSAAMLRFFEKQREKLLEERATYTHQAESLRLEAEQLAEEMEPGDIQFDEESGEGATMNVERERDLTLSAQASAAVDEINRALAKIEAGTYGLCEQCGQPIVRARLEALPYASLCVACKSGGLSRR